MRGRLRQLLASVFDQAPAWLKYWGLIQRSAREYGMNANETLAVHIFEAGVGANPSVAGPVAKGAQAIGLAQIWDKTVSKSTNSKDWKKFASKWRLRDGQVLGGLKENAEFSIDYLAWRMAGTRSRYKSIDSWYKAAYNPGFTRDSRGNGPSFYLRNNPAGASGASGTPFPVQGHSTKDFFSVWGDDRDGGSRLHKGIDIAAPMGTPVIAVADGKIGISRGGAGGNAIWLNGKFYYAHLSKFAVKEGQRVKKGDVIGYVGTSGTSSTGPHLHFGIDPKGGRSAGGSWIDPNKFLNGATGVSDGGALGEQGLPPEANPLDFMFPDAGIPLPGGGPRLPGGGPQLPGSRAGGITFQRRDQNSQSWQLIAGQDNAGPDARREAANAAGTEEI